MEEQNLVPEKTNKLPKWLTTVTPFSKALAMILFIALPFVGFYLGAQYQEKTIPSLVEFRTIPTPTPTFHRTILTLSPTPTPIQTDSSTTDLKNGNTLYENKTFNFSFEYPSSWKLVEQPQLNSAEDFHVYVTSPNGMSFNFATSIFGVGGLCDMDPNHDLGHEPINFMGSNLNLFYYGDKSANTVSSAYIIPDDQQCVNIAFFDIKSVGGLDSSNQRSGLESITIAYINPPVAAYNWNSKLVNASTFKSSEDLKTIKQIISTFKAIQ